MLDSVKTAAKEEAKAELPSSSDQQSTEQSSESTTSSSSSTEASGSLAEKAYKKGYDCGMSRHTISLDYYTEENEKELKDSYMMKCRGYGGLGDENYNNKALYKEFRRGFFKGYEDGNNAL